MTYIANDAFEQCNLQVFYGYSDFAWEFAEESNVLYYDMWKITGNS